MTRTLEALRKALERLPDALVVLSVVDSTQALALRLADTLDGEPRFAGTIAILARTQTRGMGRDGRTWVSPPGGLYLTRLDFSPGEALPDGLPLLAAAAALRALDAVGIRAGLRWPNDLVLADAKVGGLLVHARRGEPSWSAVGLGLNVTALPVLPHGEEAPVTRLADHWPGGPPPEDAVPRLAAAFLDGLRVAIGAPGPARRLWEDRLLHRVGDPLRVRTGPSTVVTGTYLGVTSEGHLRLAVDGTERTFASGILEP